MAEKEITPIELSKAESLCICKDCPTYFDCDEPLAFCFYNEGISSCITVERGCICPGCPVSRDSGLEFDFYCTKGSEKAQKINGR